MLLEYDFVFIKSKVSLSIGFDLLKKSEKTFFKASLGIKEARLLKKGL